jgi:hypothetical protein
MLKNTLQKKIENFSIKKQFNYESKSQAICNKHFFLFKQKVKS